jgi:hypothetical protein
LSSLSALQSIIKNEEILVISVLMAGHNESKNAYFWQTIAVLKKLKALGLKIEIIAGVSASGDNTAQRLEELRIPLIECETMMRSERFNQALEHARARDKEWIVLNHPRSILETRAWIELAQLESHHHWGAFTHQFDHQHPLLNFTSWWSNHVRGDLKQIFYLDHCVFIKRYLLEKIGGVPPVEIFEDTLLSIELRKHCSPIRLPWKSTTSAIRFQTNGFVRQACKNQLLKWQFYCRRSDKEMNKSYEKGINLNNDQW